MTRVRIRPVLAGDATALAELSGQLGYPSTPADITHRLDDMAANPHAAVLVAVASGERVVGWVQVERVASLATSDSAHIGGLVVDEAHRSGGIGALLLAAAEEWARRHGARSMSVASRIVRERAHRFYERAGYRLRKTSHTFVKPLV